MRVVVTLVTFLLSLAVSTVASADRRVAFVVGNGAYTHAPALANPANDAREVAAALERLGFDVVSGFDLKNADLRLRIRDFATKLAGADVALFFYAGHGLQVGGENFLIPVDAAISTEADLDFNAVKMDLVSRQMDRETKIKIVMLDACRDNPFEKQLARSMSRTRSATLKKGLAEIGSNVGGTLIAFATDPGDVALDGDGKHSPFTTALLRHIETPGIEVGLMMRRVTKDVFEATKERQRPWTNASLTGEFYMKPGDAPPAAAPAPGLQTAAVPPATGGFDERQMEMTLWQSAEKSGSKADYEEYIKQYPNGRFAGLARNRIAAAKPGDVRTAAVAPTNTATPELGRSLDPGARSPDEVAEEALGIAFNDRIGIQRRLMLLGFDPRGVDGSFGPGTRNAIGAWQRSRTFAPTGFFNAQTYPALLSQTEAQYAQWLQAQRARAQMAPVQTAPAPTYQPQPAAQQPTTTAQPAPSPSVTPRDVINGAGAVRDMIRIFR